MYTHTYFFFLRLIILCVGFIARGRTNIELREKFILPEGASQAMTPFRSRGRRSKPSSRAASPTRSSSSASQSNHSCTSMPSSPATPASGTKVSIHPHGVFSVATSAALFFSVVTKRPPLRKGTQKQRPGSLPRPHWPGPSSKQIQDL